MGLLILMRHGLSVWNKHNLFTGWVDIPLSAEGIEESLKGGEKIADQPIDIVFTSGLVRAQMTAFLALSKHHSGKVPVVIHEGEAVWSGNTAIYNLEAEKNTIPVYYSMALNERMYGELQGLNKADVAKKYGDEQVKIWRRSYDIPPPKGESLAMTAARTLPYFNQTIRPLLDQGKNVFIAAHGNSLRSIVMELDNLTKEQVLELEIATGDPLLYPWKT